MLRLVGDRARVQGGGQRTGHGSPIDGAGPNQVRVELEFKTEGEFEEFSPKGKFKDRSGVELRIGEGNNPLVTAPLREDRSKPGRVVVSFNADRAHLDKIDLWVWCRNH